MRFDCHFHPNFNYFSKTHVRRRSEAIWKQFALHKLNAVIVTEHAFKSPILSYKHLLNHRPTDATTHLIPGVEAITKEGMEMIVFSIDEHVYSQADIMTPYILSIDEMFERVQNDDQLFGVVTHPFILSNTAIVKYRTTEQIINAMDETGIVEKYNAALIPLQTFMEKIRLQHVLPNIYKRLNKTKEVPDELLSKKIIVLGGSDAHHPWDLGTYLHIVAPEETDYAQTFSIMINPTYKRSIHWCKTGLPIILSLIVNGMTVFIERIRKTTGLYKIETIPEARTEEMLEKKTLSA